MRNLWEQRKSLTWPLGLVAQTGMFGFLDSASGTPGNKTWTDRFMSPFIQYHCTSANQYVTSHVFYICVYLYVIISGATEVPAAFLSFFLNFFVVVQCFWSTPGKDGERDGLQIQHNSWLFTFYQFLFQFPILKFSAFWFNTCSRGGSEWNGK